MKKSILCIVLVFTLLISLIGCIDNSKAAPDDVSASDMPEMVFGFPVSELGELARTDTRWLDWGSTPAEKTYCIYILQLWEKVYNGLPVDKSAKPYVNDEGFKYYPVLAIDEFDNYNNLRDILLKYFTEGYTDTLLSSRIYSRCNGTYDEEVSYIDKTHPNYIPNLWEYIEVDGKTYYHEHINKPSSSRYGVVGSDWGQVMCKVNMRTLDGFGNEYVEFRVWTMSWVGDVKKTGENSENIWYGIVIRNEKIEGINLYSDEPIGGYMN